MTRISGLTRRLGNNCARICFILILVFAATGARLRSADIDSATYRVTYIVRVDPATGRLVRAAAQVAPPAGENRDAQALTETVDRIAVQNDIDRELVHSMIKVESNYNPNAVSRKGAQGLMQLIPSTARRFGVSNTFNPVQNVEGGVRYLKYLLAQYKGDYHLALAAYNAGEGAVGRYRGIPPYPETLHYVLSVDKHLSEAKRARKAAEKPAAESRPGAYNVIEASLDARGKVHYRTQ